MVELRRRRASLVW